MSDPSAPITIFTASEYDAAAVRRKRCRLATVVVVLLIAGALGWHFRFLGYELRVKSFFTAVQDKQFEKAYGIWNNDPQWKQHPQQYGRYTVNEFYLDWGPAGEYGPIHSFHIDGAENPGHKSGSGVIVYVTVNDRSEKARIWVEKKDKKLSFAPDIVF